VHLEGCFAYLEGSTKHAEVEILFAYQEAGMEAKGGKSTEDCNQRDFARIKLECGAKGIYGTALADILEFPPDQPPYKFSLVVPKPYTLFQYVLHPSMTTFDATTISIPPSEASRPRAPTLTVDTLVRNNSEGTASETRHDDDDVDLDAQSAELKESLLSKRTPHDAWRAISAATKRRSDAIKAATSNAKLSPGSNAENERPQAGQSPPGGK
jgi:hypothetical protein